MTQNCEVGRDSKDSKSLKGFSFYTDDNRQLYY